MSHGSRSPAPGQDLASNQRTPSPEPDYSRNRLPNLFEVLARKTLPPIDLFSFYIYMRDQQRSVDYLDFWLDVSQHMSLCRHYVRELRRSILVGTPELEKGGSKRSSAVLEGLGDMNHPSATAGPSYFATEKEKGKDAQMSAFLRQDMVSGGNDHSRHGSDVSKASTGLGAGIRKSSSNTEPPRPSFMSSPLDLTSDSNSPAHAVARSDIRQSAEKILYTFLLPGAEREIILPHSITNDITVSIEELGRDDPEVFDAAKDYVYQAMERDAFPGFLRMKALGNLTPTSSMVRLILGLLAFFGGFWAAFILIFLDSSRTTRCWLILPFTVGSYCLVSHQYNVDPVMGFLGFSEYAFMKFSKTREPYIRKLITKRSVTVVFFTALIAVALCVLFIFVPGKRL